MNSSFSSKSSLCKLATAATKWINSVPQTAATTTTFAFYSVSILLLWLLMSISLCSWSAAGCSLLTPPPPACWRGTPPSSPSSPDSLWPLPVKNSIYFSLGEIVMNKQNCTFSSWLFVRRIKINFGAGAKYAIVICAI